MASRSKQLSRGINLNAEEKCSELVRGFIVGNDWDFVPEYQMSNGKRIDYLVAAENGSIQFGIECKRRMSEEYQRGVHATVLADYFEQAAAYAKELDVPVFLGPVVHDGSKSDLYRGGEILSSLAALNIFGGRMNVGTLTNLYSGGDYNWVMILRGAAFWGYDSGLKDYAFNESRLSVARTTGSKLERVPLAHVIEEAAERENDREAIRRWRENMDEIDGW